MLYTKYCSACNTDLPTENFAKKGKGFQSICKSCRAVWFKNHYQENKQYYFDRNRITAKRNINKLKEYKQTLSCTKCGYKENPNILQFHHLNPIEKEDSIAAMIKGNSWNRVQKEIQKCIVLCPNCHMDLHDKERSASSVVDNAILF